MMDLGLDQAKVDQIIYTINLTEIGGGDGGGVLLSFFFIFFHSRWKLTSKPRERLAFANLLSRKPSFERRFR